MKIFRLKNYSFTTKIILTFFIFVSIFMSIRFILIIPKIEQESLNQEIIYINRFLIITKKQLKIVTDVLEMQLTFQEKIRKEEIENEIKELDMKSNQLSKQELINLIKTNPIINSCSYTISSNDFYFEKINKDRRGEIDNFFYKNNSNVLNQWTKEKIESGSNKFIQSDYSFYNYLNTQKELNLSIQCSKIDFNTNYGNLSKSIKDNINANLLLNTSIETTRISLFWVNQNLDINSNEILSEEDIKKRKEKYILSNLSNVKNISTGNLTIKEIFEARDKKPIEHKLDGETLLSWIVDLSYNNNYFLLVYSINKKELENKSRAMIFFLLPEIFAMGISFILMLFLFRRMLKDVDTLTKTAIKANQGIKNIRSNVKGDDDIGILGRSFDSMLDFFENSIKTLDKKVEEKTKEISKSLEEKEILLKEIHHRVKNNLALTISLIELQEEEIQDEKAKKVLLNIQERLYTMELLHRKLYESTNLNKISLKSYITDLVQTIAKTYIKENEIDIKINIEDVNLNIETAMPYGLILNELLTNAFKYAFKNQKNPTLIIDISKSEDDKILFIVKDNGEGLKKEFSKISNETLGLRLISMIVKYQLMGEIFYEYENGAKFIIEGKINN
jgi:two-component system, sensor histidine kinase PdtaS